MPYEVDGKLYTIWPLVVDGKEIVPIVNSHNKQLLEGEELQKLIDGLIYVRDSMGADSIKLFNDERQAEIDKEWHKIYEEYENPAPRKKKKPKRKGHVYLISEHFTNTYKIGRATNLQTRSTQFGVKLPFEWSFVCAFKSSDHEALETSLHEKFAHLRGNGEWFNLTDDDVAFFKEGIFHDSDFAKYEIEVAECPK